MTPVGVEDRCGATEWVPCDDETTAHAYRVCTMPKGHNAYFHREYRDGKMWAMSSGDDGPVALPYCEHTKRPS
jgi:hypothetical protein